MGKSGGAVKPALLRIGLASGLALAACAPEPYLPLPDVLGLPHDYNQECSCVVGGQCAMLDRIAGEWEVRNLSCRWVRRNRNAECSFERRCVEWIVPDEDSIRRAAQVDIPPLLTC